MDIDKNGGKYRSMMIMTPGDDRHHTQNNQSIHTLALPVKGNNKP